MSNYDRFIVLGVEGTQHVVVMFTSSSEETRRLLTYNNFISPGTPIKLLCPKVIGYLKNTQNPLVKTGDPLVPSVRGNILKPPPVDVSLGKYVFFYFLVTNFRIVQAVPKTMCVWANYVTPKVQLKLVVVSARRRKNTRR